MDQIDKKLTFFLFQLLNFVSTQKCEFFLYIEQNEVHVSVKEYV